MTAPLAKIGLLSIGDMGAGIARLLVANGFSVATNCSGRSADTVERARAARVELLATDADLVRACPVILSVVPPRDAAATAQRVVDALSSLSSSAPAPASSSHPGEAGERSGAAPLYFADLNAVAPSTVRGIAALFEGGVVPGGGVVVRFVDGSIIGGPPAPPNPAAGEGEGWSVPSIPTSGPHRLSDIPEYGEKLSDVLNMRHIGSSIGSASGLKMCYASTTKGLTAIAVQSYATAHRLGVLGELRRELGAGAARAERSLVSMPPKAYRWVREMEEIALTFEEEGGFSAAPSALGDGGEEEEEEEEEEEGGVSEKLVPGGNSDGARGGGGGGGDGDGGGYTPAPSMFRGAAEVYRAVAEDTVLGQERVGSRRRGLDPEDVARAVAEGLRGRKRRRRGEE